MTTTHGAIAGAQAADAAAQGAARDWAALRSAGDIQFAPVADPPPEPTPEWLKALGRFLEWLFGNISRPMLWIIAALLVCALAWIVWTFLGDWLASRRPKVQHEVPDEPQWAPDRAQALALLGEADRLAAEGQYDEAAHLLLRRSVQHIAEARPGWVRRATTARELAALAALPDAARSAFAVIAGRVERSRYALRALDLGDWTAARAAYADFALQRLAGQ